MHGLIKSKHPPDAFGKDETDWFLKNLHRDKEAMQKLNRLQSKYSQYRHSAGVWSAVAHKFLDTQIQLK